MLIIRVMGGLGNQLFQYALYELMKQRGQQVCLDISHYDIEEGLRDKRELDLLLFENISFEECTLKQKYKYLDERNNFFDLVRRKLQIRYCYATEENAQYMPEIFDMTEGYLQGYWNSERYSGKIEHLLQKKLRFPRPSDERNVHFAKKMQEENSVSVHVRRGDYLEGINVEIFGGICTQQYYRKALEIIEQKIENPTYYLFCEDSEYMQQYAMKDNVYIIDWNTGRNSIFDMYLMSQCRVNVCANSTFSVWAAKLNKRSDRIRIRPERLDNKVVQGREEVDALLNNQWILIDKCGKVID